MTDEHHTMEELYDYRMVYHALAVRAWSYSGYPTYRSYYHHDGSIPFGDPMWFIVVTELPTGQVSNHYSIKYWDMFDHAFQCTSRESAMKCLPKYDGHNPEQALARLMRYVMRDYHD